MDEFKTTIDRHRAAIAIKAAIVIGGRTQAEVADKLGLNRQVLNAFLNRKVDLLPEDIQAIIKELEIERLFPLMSSSAEISEL